MTKIAFIIPYFGNFPDWMPYTIQSMRHNPTIDFYFISDNPKPSDWPDNIYYEQTTFEDYKKMVSQKLGIDFDPKSPYKLCEIKPTYGFLHQDLISDYDYWGFCDIDLVFGDIRQFFPEEFFKKYDFFSAYSRRVAGHFTFMKNSPVYNEAFKLCPTWKKEFTDESKHYCFDEKSFSDLFIGFKNFPVKISHFLSHLFKPLAKKALLREEFSTPLLRYNWIDGSRNFPNEWYWRQGKLTTDVTEREFLYFHFLYWKRQWDPEIFDNAIKDYSTPIEAFKVSANGFESPES